MGKLHKLSAAIVRKETKNGRYVDGGGLYLNVTNTGSKSWIFRYMKRGQDNWMGIGPYPDTSLAEARETAADLRRKILAGEEPAFAKQKIATEARAEREKAKTFDWCAQQYIQTFKPTWKNAKHAAQWTSTLRKYAYPIIGDMDVRKIDLDHVLRVIEPIWQKVPETSERVRGRIEAILGWATVKAFRTGDNPARWKGHIEYALPRRDKQATVENQPALAYGELKEFMPLLRKQEGIAARAVELTILTCARSGEVRGAVWSEFDLDTATWTIPANRMKAKRAHRVALSSEAVAILRKMEAIKSGDLVFPGMKEGKMLSDMSLTAVLRRMHGVKLREGQRGWLDAQNGKRVITVHGFRSTFRDWVAEQTDHPRELAELALAHSVGSAVERAYMHSDMFEKRRGLSQDWANYSGHTN
jgi:integrase